MQIVWIACDWEPCVVYAHCPECRRRRATLVVHFQQGSLGNGSRPINAGIPPMLAKGAQVESKKAGTFTYGVSSKYLRLMGD